MVTFMIMESTSGKHSPTPGTHESMSSRLGDGEQGCQAIQAKPRELEKLFFKRPRALCLRLTGSGIMSGILSTLLGGAH